MKGLEYDLFVHVVHDEQVSNDLVYVGASRADMSLTVIAPTGGTGIFIAAGDRNKPSVVLCPAPLPDLRDLF